MKRLFLAAMFAMMLPASAFAWSNSCGDNCGQAAVDNGQAKAQQQHQSQNAYGGKGGTAYGGAGGQGGTGGQGGLGGTGGNGYGGSASATGGNASATGGAASSNSGGNVFSVNNDPAVSSVVVSPSALSGLAASECVLSDTQSVGAGLQLMQIGIAGAEGTGHTKPYDECNTRAALPYVAAATGQIQGVDTKIIYANMVSTLTGVQAAIDKAKGKTSTDQSSAVPASGPVQTASAAPAVNPSCIGANTKTNWYANNCQ